MMSKALVEDRHPMIVYRFLRWKPTMVEEGGSTLENHKNHSHIAKISTEKLRKAMEEPILDSVRSVVFKGIRDCRRLAN